MRWVRWVRTPVLLHNINAHTLIVLGKKIPSFWCTGCARRSSCAGCAGCAGHVPFQRTPVLLHNINDHTMIV